jgi:outer membrane receptor protein involved in Fe transport
MTPTVLFNWLDDYYTFDVNLPETLQESHTKTDLRLGWKNDNGLSLEAFILNIEDEAVLARTVVHSQRVAGTSINSVQANWNPPQTIGFSMSVEF